jgi:hypothetical protein
MIKVTRKLLLMITAGMGIFLIGYSLIRHFTGFGFGEAGEKYMMDVIIIGALGLFMYNRKMARDERLAKEAAAKAEEEAERRAAEGPEEVIDPEEDNLPHWERSKKAAGDTVGDPAALEYDGEDTAGDVDTVGDADTEQQEK